MVRNPVVAGQFYSGSREGLLREVASLTEGVAGSNIEAAIGVVSPHAGYVYSGTVAGAVLGSITPRRTYIILGPNHTGLGAPFSLSKADAWMTPIGEVKVDNALAGELKRISRYIKEDDAAHAHEHSIEVQLPFLQVLSKDFTIVPVVVAHSELEVLKKIGKEIAQSVKTLDLESSITMIASSDMTHYEAHKAAKHKDAQAIEAILELDEEKLMNRIERLEISMCGYAPTAVMIAAAKELGATTARLVKYQTSGDVSGDYSSVVGYAGIIIR